MIVNDLNINVKIIGEEIQGTICILQGWGTSLEVYDSIANSLSCQYRIIQLDLPGFGGSDEPKKAWSVKDYCLFVTEFLKELKVMKVSLIGHSYGGRMCIWLAGNKPEGLSIDKMVLMDSAGIMPPMTIKRRLKIMQYKVCKYIVNLKLIDILFHDAIEEWKSKQGSLDYRSASMIMKQCLVSAVNEDLREYLPLIDVDTLLIWGENDEATPISDGRIMDSLIPNSGMVEVKNAGHYPHLEQPVVVDKVLRSYFNVT